jgi:lysozyme
MPVLNAAGMQLLEESEGCVLYAYDDANDRKIEPGDPIEGTLTIGYGHTGPDVHPGMAINQTEADVLLDADLRCFEVAVNNMVAENLTPNQFAALVDFAYNEGATALKTSTLLRLLNDGDAQGAADQFAVWDEANGKVLPGLVERRAKERALFLTP